MGQNGSKLSYSVPKKAPCFPYFSNEKDLLKICTKASTTLCTAQNVVQVISGVVPCCATGPMAKVSLFLSTTSTLINFVLSNLSETTPPLNPEAPHPQQKSPLPSPVPKVESNNNGRPVPQPVKTHLQRRSPEVEDAFIQMKIDKALAKNSVQNLRAKLVAVKNRYDRLLQQGLTEEERKLEVVPGMTLCEEILELFRNSENIFGQNPLISAPFVCSFGRIYVAFAELSIAILPSYQPLLKQQMNTLQETLQWYATSCIRKRMETIKLPSARIAEDSMMTCAASVSLNQDNFRVQDKFFPSQDAEWNFQQFNSEKEALEAYEAMLKEMYAQFFDGVLEGVQHFLGFLDQEDFNNVVSLENSDDDFGSTFTLTADNQGDNDYQDQGESESRESEGEGTFRTEVTISL